MATLLLTAVGTVFGGPLGGALGALVGRQVDAAVFGSGTTKGPRLQDLSVQTSSYGAAVPLHFGRVRSVGSVIWATNLVEHTQKQGGGKGRPSVTSYTYTASFAVALSSRPIERVGRIWADGNLLRGTSGELKAAGTLRVHTGEGDQPADPLIAQAESLASCPAHRGLAYAVFEDLALADFGNRIPSLTFEIFAEEAGTSVAQVVTAIATEARVSGLDAALAGYTIDSGTGSDALATLDQVVPLAAWIDGDDLFVTAAEAAPAAPPLLPAPAAGGSASDAVKATGWSRHRGPLPSARLSGLRYYDAARDYQPGLQQSIGRSAPGGLAVIEFPATLDATAARGLVEAVGKRRSHPSDTLKYRVTTIDSDYGPGAAVRVPVAGGLWRVEHWEWQPDGVLLDLVALPAASATGEMGSDAGRSLVQPDLAPAPTQLAAVELPWDGTGSGDTPALFAAASATSAGWTGAGLFVQQPGATLVPIGTTGRRRAIIGTTLGALGTASPLLLDRRNRLDVALAGKGLVLAPAGYPALCQGANRALVGEELIQFGAVTWLSDVQVRLTELVRGLAGTEWAVDGHAAGERFVLVDENLVPLDALAVAPAASATILGTGLADEAPATSPVIGAGSTRRPYSPVRVRARLGTGGEITLDWVRRARGAFGWLDQVDVPLNESVEAWDVSYGDPYKPEVRWRTSESRLVLDAATVAGLTAAPAQFAVRQVGAVSLSMPAIVVRPT